MPSLTNCQQYVPVNSPIDYALTDLFVEMLGYGFPLRPLLVDDRELFPLVKTE